MPGVEAKGPLWVNTMIRRLPQRGWWSSSASLVMWHQLRLTETLLTIDEQEISQWALRQPQHHPTIPPSWHEIKKQRTTRLSRHVTMTEGLGVFQVSFWRVGKGSAGWGRRTRWLRVKADGLCSLHQSDHKGDVIDRAGQNKAATFGALRAPPLPIAPILSHFMFTDYFPLPHCPIIPQQQQANLSIQLGSRLPSCCVI